MSEELKACPFCKIEMVLFGHDLNSKKEVIDTITHPVNDDAETREEICPLSMLVFPVDKWQQRPIEDALRAEVERYKQWVNDLHSGMYVNCVYCGHRYGPEDEVPVSMADVLKEHVEQCPEHPMSKLKAELAALRETMREAVENCETCGGGEFLGNMCCRCETFTKLLPAPPEEE